MGAIVFVRVTEDTVSLNGKQLQLTDDVALPADLDDLSTAISDLAAIAVDGTTLTTKGDLFVRDSTGINRLPVGSDTQVLTADSAQSLGVKWAAASGGSSLPVVDTTAIAKGSSDATKQVRFEVDGLTTATTRVITVPDADITLARTDAGQTFTGDQAINGAVTITKTSAQLSLNYDGSNKLTVDVNAFGNSTLTPSGGFLDLAAGCVFRAQYMVLSTTMYVGSSGNSVQFNHLADGVLLVANDALTDFGRVCFGGSTSSFPAIKRSGVTMEDRLADDSAYTQRTMLQLGIVDGVTAPSATAGLAKIYVDTADGDLKVIFGDGTVKTIVTD